VLVFGDIRLQDHCNLPEARGMRGIMSKIGTCGICDATINRPVKFDPFT